MTVIWHHVFMPVKDIASTHVTAAAATSPGLVARPMSACQAVNVLVGATSHSVTQSACS
jgi:hypothetical protein